MQTVVRFPSLSLRHRAKMKEKERNRMEWRRQEARRGDERTNKAIENFHELDSLQLVSASLPYLKPHVV